MLEIASHMDGQVIDEEAQLSQGILQNELITRPDEDDKQSISCKAAARQNGGESIHRLGDRPTECEPPNESEALQDKAKNGWREMQLQPAPSYQLQLYHLERLDKVNKSGSRVLASSCRSFGPQGLLPHSCLW